LLSGDNACASAPLALFTSALTGRTDADCHPWAILLRSVNAIAPFVLFAVAIFVFLGCIATLWRLRIDHALAFSAPGTVDTCLYSGFADAFVLATCLHLIGGATAAFVLGAITVLVEHLGIAHLHRGTLYGALALPPLSS
jgi:hypothetical protein